MVSHVFTSVYCLCTYIPSLFVISMEGLVLFLWLSGVICKYTECPVTHRQLSVVCIVFTYKTYSWHTTEYLQCDRPCTLAYATIYRPLPIIDQLVTHRHLSVVCSVFTVRIPLNIYSVTDCTHYIMSVSGQCTFVFQWSLWEHMALQTMTVTPYV